MGVKVHIQSNVFCFRLKKGFHIENVCVLRLVNEPKKINNSYKYHLNLLGFEKNNEKFNQ